MLGLLVLAAVGVGAFVLLSGDDDDDGGGDGGDGGDGDEISDEVQANRDDPQYEEYVEAMVASVEGSEDFPASSDDARCMAQSFVDVVGVDRISAEATPEEIAEDPDWELEGDPTQEEASAVYGLLNECMDVRGLMEAGWSEAEEIGPEAGACMAEALSDESLEALMISSMMGEDDEPLEIEDEGARDQLASDLGPCARDIMYQSMAADAGEEFADCAVDAIGDEMLGELMAAGMFDQTDTELEGQIQQAIEPCRELAEQ